MLLICHDHDGDAGAHDDEHAHDDCEDDDHYGADGDDTADDNLLNDWYLAYS